MQDFRKLRVWVVSHEFRLQVYRQTRNFPRDEIFGLTSQLRRAASSIPSNIAESCGYRGRADSARFVQIAYGSSCEVLDHLIAARDLGYLPCDEYNALTATLESIRRMLYRLLVRMRS